MRKHNKISAFLLYAFILGACVPVPLPYAYETPFPDEIVQFIDDGSTMRETVLLNLGEPTVVRNNDTLFVYAAVRAVGEIVLLSPGGGSGIPITKAWFLFIEFDENGTVVRHEVGTGFENPPCKRSGECNAFDQVWNEVPFSETMRRKDTGANDFQSYLSKHPDSVFADFAQMRLECMSITETTTVAEGTGLDASTKSRA